jgi:hypothetical protein
MATESANPIVMKFPLGLNNKARETALPDGALRVCTNMDVTREGTLSVRKGMRRISQGDWHSLYAHPHRHYLCAVQDGYLGIWRDSVFEPVVSGISSSVRYTDLNGDVFWTDGQKQGRFDVNGVPQPWGLAPPAFVSVRPVIEGGFDAGQYQVALTSIYQGLESGALSPDIVTVEAGGGIEVTVPTTAALLQFGIYVTPANGGSQSLFKVDTVSSGTTVVIGRGHQPGKRLESLYAVKPLPANYLVTYKGRIWAATDSILWFTDTLSPHWLFPDEGYYQFDSSITLLAAAEDGLYIAAGERTYFLQGAKPTDMTLRPVLYDGAVPGCSTGEFPYHVLVQEDGMIRTRSCAWLSTDGVFCVGRPGGMISRATDKMMSLNIGRRGTLSFWQDDGMRRFLISVDSVGEQMVVNPAMDRQVRQVFKNGVNLLV